MLLSEGTSVQTAVLQIGQQNDHTESAEKAEEKFRQNPVQDGFSHADLVKYLSC